MSDLHPPTEPPSSTPRKPSAGKERFMLKSRFMLKGQCCPMREVLLLIEEHATDWVQLPDIVEKFERVMAAPCSCKTVANSASGKAIDEASLTMYDLTPPLHRSSVSTDTAQDDFVKILPLRDYLGMRIRMQQDQMRLAALEAVVEAAQGIRELGIQLFSRKETERRKYERLRDTLIILDKWTREQE